MFNQFCKLTFVVTFFFLNSVAAQDSLRVERFNEIFKRVQKMMGKKGSSLEHLTVVYRQLSEYADVDTATFNNVSQQRFDYNLNERMRYVKSRSKEYLFQQALVSMAILENEYKDNSAIKDLAIKTKNTVRKTLLKNIKESRIDYTIEPSFSYYTLGKKLSEFPFFNSPGTVFMFSLAGYKTFNLQPKEKKSNRQGYTYSQAGLKIDYFNGMLIPQLSALFTQTSGIDIGYAFNFSNSQEGVPNVNFYSINIAAYYPIDFLSIGVNARLLSDFSDNHYLHYGLTLKYNMKIGNKITAQELSKMENDIDNINFTPLK